MADTSFKCIEETWHLIDDSFDEAFAKCQTEEQKEKLRSAHNEARTAYFAAKGKKFEESDQEVQKIRDDLDKANKDVKEAQKDLDNIVNFLEFAAAAVNFAASLAKLAFFLVFAAHYIPTGMKTRNSGDDIGAQPQDVGVAALMAAWERDWRVADSLRILQNQADERAPQRNRDSDGTIGDAAHQSRKSDHNPWVTDGNVGVVTAMDITHDPKGGCDVSAMAQSILNSQDVRVKYIIFNKRIASSSAVGSRQAWEWGPYTGENPHSAHVHISVQPDKAYYDSLDFWKI